MQQSYHKETSSFTTAVHAIVPELTEDEQGLFKTWMPLMIDEESWNGQIENYFVSCQTEIYDNSKLHEIATHATTRIQNQTT